MDNWIPVTSSMINAYCYGEKDKCLYIKFQNGIAYGYEGVSKGTLAHFVRADSKGSFLNKNIKGKYTSFRV